MRFPMIASLLFAATLQTNVADVTKVYERDYASRLVPLLSEVLRFPTTQFDTEGHAAQKEWLAKTAHDLGLIYRDAGLIDEIELPGPAGAPVLGLMVHGDVQPVDADAWSVAPFAGTADDTFVYGRGSADDKGPLVQALLAMKALEQSGIKRTHTVRLLVGSDEESGNTDVTTYLKSHQAPDYTLVLDSGFPVIVGEKAWNSLSVTTDALAERGTSTKPYAVSYLDAGLGTSIVPERAEVKLRWKEGTALNWQPLIDAVTAAPRPPDTRIATKSDGEILRIVAYGHSAHAGVNLEGGRNALVALADALAGKLPRGGADDLLTFARTAGKDLYGTGLGITDRDPVWGRYAVNVATDDQHPPHPAAQRSATERKDGCVRGGLQQANRRLAHRYRLLRRRTSRIRSEVEAGPTPPGRLRRCDGIGESASRNLRRRHVREATAERHRLRHVVPRRTVSGPRRRRKEPDRRSAEGDAGLDPRAGRYRDRPEDRRAVQAVVGQV
jgi:hypothetical protein